MPNRLFDFDENLFGHLGPLQKHLDDLFGNWPGTRDLRNSGTRFPPLNVEQHTDKVVLYLFAAGLDLSKVSIDCHQNQLTIEGQRTIEKPAGSRELRQERYHNGFRRVVNLPKDVEAEAIEARYHNGVLIITAPRRTAAPTRRISISKEG